MKHQAAQNGGGLGLSPTQVEILTMVAASQGGMRPSAIAAQLAVSQPTVAESARVLVEKGLIEKTPDPDDARAIRIVLTEAGREEAKRAAGWPDFLVSAAEAMSEQEQEHLLSGLVKIIRTLDDRDQIPVNRMCVTCTHFRPHQHLDPEYPHHCMLVDAPMSPKHLRLDCPEQEPADDETRDAIREAMELER